MSTVWTPRSTCTSLDIILRIPYATGNIIVSQNQTLLLPTLFLVNGDINNDNQLSILDYSILKNCFEQKFHSSFCIVPATTSSPGPDLDDDGVVTGSDYNFFLREFIKQ